MDIWEKLYLNDPPKMVHCSTNENENHSSN